MSLPNAKGTIVLEECKIRRGIFQGDSFSPLIFCLAMAPLSGILKRAKIGVKIDTQTISHLKYIDDLKIYTKNKSELKRSIDLIETFSKDIKMNLGIDKCGIVNVIRGKMDNDKFDSEIPTLPESDSYKYLGISESSVILHDKMKDKAIKEMFKRVRALAKAKLTAVNFAKAYNTFALPVLRYGFGILNWNKTELVKLDRKMRRVLTKAGFHHPKSNTHRLHMSREDGGRGVKSLWNTYEEECAKIATYLKANHRNDPLTSLVARLEGKKPKTISILRFDDVKSSVKKHAEEHLRDFKGMKLHGQWRVNRDAIASVDVVQSDKWLKQAHLTSETESVLCAAQEQTLATNYIRKHIWGTECNPLCRLCKECPETISHIVSGCKCLASNKYTNRHNKVGTYIHWSILRDLGIKVCNEWFRHTPEKVVEHGKSTIMWDVPITTDKKVGANRPDITIHDREKNKALLIDFSVPYDTNIILKTAEKLTKYKELEIELKKCWKLTSVEIIPVIIGALGTVSTDLKKYLNLISENIDINVVQKTALLGTANILRGILSTENII